MIFRFQLSSRLRIMEEENTEYKPEDLYYHQLCPEEEKNLIKVERIGWLDDYDKRMLEKKIHNHLTEKLSRIYPSFSWLFKNIVVPGLKYDEREIYVVRHNNRIASSGILTVNFEDIGYLILKNTETESKICTLYIDEGYRNQDIG